MNENNNDLMSSYIKQELNNEKKIIYDKRLTQKEDIFKKKDLDSKKIEELIKNKDIDRKNNC